LTEKSAQVPLYCWNFWCIGAVPIYYAKIVLSLLEILSEYSIVLYKIFMKNVQILNNNTACKYQSTYTFEKY
jgi:hypothetical protein